MTHRVTQVIVQGVGAALSPIRVTQALTQAVSADKTLPIRVTQVFAQTITSIDQGVRPGVPGSGPTIAAIPVVDTDFVGVESVEGFAEPFQPTIFDREANPFRPDLAQPVSPRIPGMINELQPQRAAVGLIPTAPAAQPVQAAMAVTDPFPVAEPSTPTDDRVGAVLDSVRESQELIRQTHEKSQAGDTTTPWEFLTRLSSDQLFTPGSIGRFYHDEYGMILARYVKFVDMDSSLKFVNAPVGRLKAAQTFAWEVTNRFEKSSAFLAEGIIAAYQMPRSGQYGWVTISGANHTRLLMKNTPRPTQWQNLAWLESESLGGNVAGTTLGYIVGSQGLTRLDPGRVFIQVGGATREQIQTYFADSFAEIQAIFDQIAERIEALEGADTPQSLGQLTDAVAQLRLDLEAESRSRASAIRALQSRIDGLDAVSGDDLGNLDMTLRNYIDAQDTQLSLRIDAALARANAAYALAESISDNSEAVAAAGSAAASALSIANLLPARYLGQGPIADRPAAPSANPNSTILWYATDTDVLSAYNSATPAWVDIGPGGGGGGPIDLDDLTDVDTTTTPPMTGDVLTYDGTEWTPAAPTGGGSGTFLGALVGKSADQALVTVTTTVITFDTESYDVGNWHSNTVNNSRLTVPSGVNRVRLSGRLSRTIQTGQLVSVFRKNGSTGVIGLPSGDTDTVGGDSVTISSAVLEVVPGDYFEMTGFVDGASSITTESWFAIEAVSTPSVSSGNSEWELLDVSGNPLTSGSTWNFFFNPVSALSIINLAPYNDIRITIRDVSTANVAFRFVRVSHDNGATFSTSGYRLPNSNVNFSTFDFNNAANNQQRYGAIVINNIKGVKYWPRLVSGDARNAGYALYDGLTSDINAVQVASSNGNMTSGTLAVYGRV